MRKVAQIDNPMQPSTFIAFSAEQKLASACSDGTVRVWDFNRGQTQQQFTSSKEATCIDFAESDEYMATGHKDGKVRLWSLSTRRFIDELASSPHSQLTSVVCSGYGDYIFASSTDNKIYKLDKRTNRGPVCTF